MEQELIEQEMNYTPMEFEGYVPKEYIRIEDGIIVEHVAGQKPEGEWIEVKEFRGTVGETANWYDTDWKRIDDITLYETGVKELPLGKKVVEGKLEDVSQREMWLNGLISDEDFAEQKRRERDSKLLATDKYIIPDYPITEEDKGVIQVYRQTLRDLPSSPDWPNVEIPDIPVQTSEDKLVLVKKQQDTEYTYVVNSNESLLYWLSNGLEGQGKSDDFTSVLITAGDWNCTLSQAPQVANTRKIVGCPRFVCTVTIATAGGTCNLFNRVLTAQDVHFILVSTGSWTGRISGFENCSDLNRCSMLVTAPLSKEAVGFYNCTALERCSSYTSAKQEFYGFRDCTLMSKCNGKPNGVSSSNPSTVIFHEGSCFADNSKNPAHKVADTPEGGFNEK